MVKKLKNNFSLKHSNVLGENKSKAETTFPAHALAVPRGGRPRLRENF